MDKGITTSIQTVDLEGELAQIQEQISKMKKELGIPTKIPNTKKSILKKYSDSVSTKKKIFRFADTESKSLVKIRFFDGVLDDRRCPKENLPVTENEVPVIKCRYAMWYDEDDKAEICRENQEYNRIDSKVNNSEEFKKNTPFMDKYEIHQSNIRNWDKIGPKSWQFLVGIFLTSDSPSDDFKDFDINIKSQLKEIVQEYINKLESGEIELICLYHVGTHITNSTKHIEFLKRRIKIL